MKFDKSRVYTALNADEVKIGSKGYFASFVIDLEIKMENDETPQKLVKVWSENETERFMNENFYSYSYFYLLEEPKEEKWRPYKDTKEMINDFCIRFTLGFANYELPRIWINSKASKDVKHCITSFSTNNVLFGNTSSCLVSLFENYTYLDGSPCGIKEY